MRKNSIPKLIEDGGKLIEALRQIDPELAIRGETQKTMNTKMERYHAVNTQLAGIDSQTTLLKNERAAIIKYFRKLPVASREVIAGIYTKDSDEYELVGGTRTSTIVRSNGRSKSTKRSATVAVDKNAPA